MKLIIAEGTPEEIRALLPDLEALNGGGIVVAGTPAGPAAEDVSVPPDDGATGTLLPADVVEFIACEPKRRMEHPVAVGRLEPRTRRHQPPVVDPAAPIATEPRPVGRRRDHDAEGWSHAARVVDMRIKHK